jgi:hypothetical protein
VKLQYREEPDTSPILPKSAITCIQQVIGTVLFYAPWAVDTTMLMIALSTLASEQASATTKTEATFQQFLNYCCATHANATIRFVASGMILCVHSADASYLSECMNA